MHTQAFFHSIPLFCDCIRVRVCACMYAYTYMHAYFFYRARVCAHMRACPCVEFQNVCVLVGALTSYKIDCLRGAHVHL